MSSSGRILLTAPKSGSGKTLLTCGLLQAWKNRGLRLRSYKCGPDYIDPMFHRYVLGVNGGNLDSYFSGEEEIRNRVARETKEADMTVIEGVMGYYDGLGGVTDQASAYDIARITDTPAVLIVDGKGMSLSMGALVKGFLEFRKDSKIRGVIANRTSPGMETRLRSCVEEAGCRFFGCMPERAEWNWSSRHLGLVLPNELEMVKETLERLAEGMEQYLDIDGILELGKEAGKLCSCLEQAPKTGGRAEPENRAEPEGKAEPVTIAVARDFAFCFYYQENLELLKSFGARLQEFSPLNDKTLPEGTDGILLGGGYPELYGRQLSNNQEMLGAIRSCWEKGMPIIGECGGFLYLLQELEGEDGKSYPMTGIMKGRGFRRDKLTRFGYVELTAGSCSLFLKEGERIRGHEFHYWDSTENGAVYYGKKPVGNQAWNCIQRVRKAEGGFPHLYYPSAPAYAERFVEECRSYHRQKR